MAVKNSDVLMALHRIIRESGELSHEAELVHWLDYLALIGIPGAMDHYLKLRKLNSIKVHCKSKP